MREDVLFAGREQAAAALRVHLADAAMAAHVMTRRCENEKDREYLGIVCRAVARSTRVLEQAELACRLRDEDELRTVLSTEELTALCGRVTAAAAELLAPLGVEVEFRTEEMTLTTQVDEGQIVQMLYELLSNGAKAMPEGGRLVVTLSRTARAAVISVGDEGSGLSGEALERLFGADARQPDLSPEAGAGLGLPLARAIAEVHGGMLVMDTAPHGGVRAAVCLPLREERHNRLKSPLTEEDERGRALVALSDVLPIRAFLPK